MLPVKFVLLTSAIIMLQTSVPPIADAVGPIERLTLVGVLCVAVRVLWQSNAAKDKQNYDMATKVTETMALVLEAVRESRLATETQTEQLGNALDNLTSNIGALPCAMEQRVTDRAEAVERQRFHGISPNKP